MKCEICSKEIGVTFLGKLKGNYVKVKGKQYPICNSCFKENKSSIKESLVKK
jgi:ribosome-binding protein aMBF1 (putative translation factor)